MRFEFWDTPLKLCEILYFICLFAYFASFFYRVVGVDQNAHEDAGPLSLKDFQILLDYWKNTRDFNQILISCKVQINNYEILKKIVADLL